MEMGDFSHVAKRYVRKVLRDAKNIDRRILFITYAGIDKKRRSILSIWYASTVLLSEFTCKKRLLRLQVIAGKGRSAFCS